MLCMTPNCSRNVVSTVNLNCSLDLESIALRARNAEYNPKVQSFMESDFSSLVLLF